MSLDRFYKFKELVQKYNCRIIMDANYSWDKIDFNRNEPDIIWQYLNKGTDYLNRHIGNTLSRDGFSVKFAGVFIHQKPRITRINNLCYPQNLKCELGDLLTVFLFLDKNKKLIFQYAFISQAKKQDKIDNKCQLCLYEKDRDFEFPKSMQREILVLKRILPSFYRRHRGLNYLILDKYPYVKYIPFKANVKVSWGFIIYQLFLGLNGLSFTRYLPKIDYIGWSRIIWDLIYFTGKAKYRNISRGNIINMFLNEFNDFDNYDKNFINSEGEGEGGIPILFIIVQDKETSI